MKLIQVGQAASISYWIRRMGGGASDWLDNRPSVWVRPKPPTPAQMADGVLTFSITVTP